MKSKVYFVPARDSESTRIVTGKIKALLEDSGLLDIIRKDYRVAVKVHFGEEGNTGFVRPQYVRPVCEGIAARGASMFLADTNTLYRGKRMTSKEHLRTARRHGFIKSASGAEVVIPDDTRKNNTIGIKTDGGLIKTAKVARLFIDADAIIAVSHFKGHILTGFGGAVKNIGMGCATREGKLAQHCDTSPVVFKDRCIGCGACVKICPADAICLVEKKSVIDTSRCIGCASCIAVCPAGAMFIDLRSGGEVQKKMVEYAAAVLKRKKGRAGFLNFAVKIKKECDCWNEDTPCISPDVGIFASADPVAIDSASFEAVKKACGRDVFKEAHPGQDGAIQLEYAQTLGLGSRDYELIEA